MSEPASLAICGTAHVHLPDHVQIATGAGWRIGAVFDRNAERAARWCTETSAERLGSVEAIAEGGHAGAIVCSETAHHEADIVALLEAGVPVFSEKPLAGSAAAAERIASAGARTGTALHTAFFLRTNRALDELRARLRAGEIGEIVEARGRFSHDGAFADWLDLGGWMTDPALACYGGFADEGVHVIDLLQWMIGPVAGGEACLGYARGFPVDDHGAAVLSFKSGATAAVQAGWTDAAMRLELDFVGTHGSASVREGVAATQPRGAANENWSLPLSPLDAGEGIRPFLAVLSGGEAPDGWVTPAEAAQVSRVLDLLYNAR